MHKYEEYIKDQEYNIFYNAPALIIVYGNTNSYWHVYDCSMVAYNLHLLAEDAGMGCCWIGFAHNVFDGTETKRELGVPENYSLVAPVILGFPSKQGVGSMNPNTRKPFAIKWK
jgi:nitroreductase